jgi:hypothetical protein
MECPKTKKLMECKCPKQTQIAGKLQELGSEFASDAKTLIDFILLMISNAKTQDHIASELGESNWIFFVNNKFEFYGNADSNNKLQSLAWQRHSS